MNDRELKTIPPPDASGSVSRDELPVLTIACHPDISRIGERAGLTYLASGKTELVSRTVPLFQMPGGGERRAIDSPNVSRKPFRLIPTRNGNVTIFPGDSGSLIELDNTPLDLPRDIDVAELSAGTVVEMNRRVVLLLHHHTPHDESGLSAHGFVGNSHGMVRLREEIERIADLEMPVLIRGESGTGKELVARAIHSTGPRRDKKLISVNLGAIPPNLAASELFGSERGAFTGATKDRQGFFRAANGGTLFLDEIGEAPPEVQVMLLRVLETGEIYPVGSQKPYKVNVRVIAATDADLESRCSDGGFKTPLLHRLASYEVWLPPLRERRDDIPRLFLYFADEALRELGDTLKRYQGHRDQPWLSSKLMVHLLSYSWPGNIRQLRNVVRQLVVGNRGSDHLAMTSRLEQMLQHTEQSPDEEAAVVSAPTSSSVAPGIAKNRKPADVTEEELRDALAQTKWEPTAAAKILGITRASVYVLLKRRGIRIADDLGTLEIQEAMAANDADIDATALALCVSPRGLRRRMVKLELV